MSTVLMVVFDGHKISNRNSVGVGLIVWSALAFLTPWWSWCFSHTKENRLSIICSRIFSYTRESGQGIFGMIPIIEYAKVDEIDLTRHILLGTLNGKKPYEAYLRKSGITVKISYRAIVKPKKGYGPKRFAVANDELIRSVFEAACERFVGSMFLDMSEDDADDLIADEIKLKRLTDKLLDGEKKMSELETEYGSEVVDFTVFDIAWDEPVQKALELEAVIDRVARCLKRLSPSTIGKTDAEKTVLIGTILSAMYPESKFTGAMLLGMPQIRNVIT